MTRYCGGSMRSNRRTVIQPVGECHIIKNMFLKVQI